MCRFKLFYSDVTITIKKFQYILCVGSSSEVYGTVTIVKEFQYILCVGSREDQYAFEQLIKVFQYILCVGSSQARTNC